MVHSTSDKFATSIEVRVDKSKHRCICGYTFTPGLIRALPTGFWEGLGTVKGLKANTLDSTLPEDPLISEKFGTTPVSYYVKFTFFTFSGS